MKFGVVVFPGSNCDHDTHNVLGEVMGWETVLLWHQSTDLQNVDVVVVPGGFSYGDYLRSGAIAKFSPIMDSIHRHADQGKLVLGICNGFQILQEARLLPGVMLPNAGLKFICRYVHLRTETSETPFTSACRKGQVLNLPIAHHDGNFFISEEELAQLEANRQIVFRYSDPAGDVTPQANPNGSVGNIAGVCNLRGNVLGLMPHPERASESLLGSEDGRLIFQSLIAHGVAN